MPPVGHRCNYGQAPEIVIGQIWIAGLNRPSHIRLMKPATEPAPTEPCPCKSGLSYGQCHKPIFDAPEGKMLDVAHDQYAKAWSRNAAHYSDQGLYLDQAQDLARSGTILKVLDVGCGHGQGIAALRDSLPQDAWILGIDENTACLAGAARLLDVPPTSLNSNRMVDQVLPNGRYRSTYLDQEVLLGASPNLLQSNLLTKDRAFDSILDGVGPLDAITLWFVGIHKANSATELASYFEVKGDADYRELVEDAVIELAGKRLKAGGVVHVAMRANYPDKAFAEQNAKESYAELLQGGRYVFGDVIARPYTEPSPQVGAVNVGAMSPLAHLPSFAISMVLRKA